MSCNGCRALRKGCSDSCILRPCLQWIESPQAQAHATLFVSKFFGRSDLLSFISSVPLLHRPALFQSLLYEACGRTVNPVDGAVGLLSTGNWHVCQAAVDTVLRGGVLHPIPPEMMARVNTLPLAHAEASNQFCNTRVHLPYMQNKIASTSLPFTRLQPSDLARNGSNGGRMKWETMSFGSEEVCGSSSMSFEKWEGNDGNGVDGGGQNRKVLNLFV